MKSLPSERDLLYKNPEDASQRTVRNMRVSNPDKKRFVPLAAP